MTLKPRFNARARKMDPDDPFDLDAEVARAYAEYPRLKGRTFFIDTASGRIVHPGLSPKTELHILCRSRVRKEIEKSKKRKGSWFHGKENLGTPYNLVFLYLEPDSINLGAFPPSYSTAQRKRAIFDHELGHALSLGAKTDRDRYLRQNLLKESMAETFMLLRQYLRYGNSKKIDAPGLIGRCVSDFCTGGRVYENYFTAPAMEKAQALKNTFNLAAMTPEWIEAAAIKTARLHTPSCFAMKDLKSELRDPRHPRSLLSLARRTMETDSEEAFKWGSAILRYRMRQDVLEHEPSGGAKAFRKKHWPKVRRQIGKREKLLRSKR